MIPLSLAWGAFVTGSQSVTVGEEQAGRPQQQKLSEDPVRYTE